MNDEDSRPTEPPPGAPEVTSDPAVPQSERAQLRAIQTLVGRLRIQVRRVVDDQIKMRSQVLAVLERIEKQDQVLLQSHDIRIGDLEKTSRAHSKACEEYESRLSEQSLAYERRLERLETALEQQAAKLAEHDGKFANQEVEVTC